MSEWTFLTNHAHVVLLLTRHPDLRMREVAERIGITERAVHRIIAELVDADYLCVEKHGRRNHYEVNTDRPLRHPVESGSSLADLVGLNHDDDG